MDRDELRRQGDELLRQGKDIADLLLREAGTQAARHEQDIKGALSSLAGLINDRTGGRYAEQVGQATGFLEHGVDLLASAGRDDSPPADPPPSSPPSG